MTTIIARRDLLKLAGSSAVLASVSLPIRRQLCGQESIEGTDLIVRSAMPINAEPSLQKLVESWLTPTTAFFVRSHGTTPQLNEKGYSLSVNGLVEKPLTLSLAELNQRFKESSATATLTCAGNRRTEFNRVKKVAGVQWDAGAIGNANWSGFRLSDVLKMAGIKPGAKHVWFEGLDQITEKGETFPFGGSITLDKAMADTSVTPGCVLATKMNDRPLTANHGFPIRSIVPGYIGARSVKWLSKITVSDLPSPNHYLAHAYKLIVEDTPAAVDAAAPIYEFVLNSLICSLATGASVKRGPLELKGVALPSGKLASSLKRIELSVDGGDTWKSAKITSPVRGYCWVHWAASVTVAENTDSILVRAVDDSGEMQPRETPWNLKGYQYNGWHKIDVKPL